MATALLDLISEEVVATVPLQMANAGVYHGHHGFLHMLEEWGEAWEDFRSEAASRSPQATAWSSPSASMAAGAAAGSRRP